MRARASSRNARAGRNAVPTEDSDAPSRGNLRRGDPRASALACLLGVLEEGRSLRDALPAALFRLERKRDKALAQNLILGVLRWYERDRKSVV